MTTLRTAAQQALEALEWISDCYVGDDDDAGECASCHQRSYKPHAPDCKKNNAITALRAALAQEQAGCETEDDCTSMPWCKVRGGCQRKQAEPAQEQAEPDLSRCPQCNGPADNGHDRSIPPSPYICTKCMAEPAQEPVTTLGYAARKIAELIAQRDALLETLKYIAKQFRQHGRQHWPEAVAARLAIEAVEGEDK